MALHYYTLMLSIYRFIRKLNCQYTGKTLTEACGLFLYGKGTCIKQDPVEKYFWSLEEK